MSENTISIENAAYMNVTRDLALDGANLNKYIYYLNLLNNNKTAPKMVVGSNATMPIVDF